MSDDEAGHDAAAEGGAESPLAVLGPIGVALSSSLGTVTSVIPEQVIGLLLMYLLWKARPAVYVATRYVVETFMADMSQDVISIIESTLSTTIFIFSSLIILGSFGVDVSALVAGLGLTGFALGFALKDVVSNLLAGVMILAFKPFVRGDTIVVEQHTGKVKFIDLRYTALKIKGEDGTTLIPNSIVFSSVIGLQAKARRIKTTKSPEPADDEVPGQSENSPALSSAQIDDDAENTDSPPDPPSSSKKKAAAAPKSGIKRIPKKTMALDEQEDDEEDDEEDAAPPPTPTRRSSRLRR